MTRNSIEYAQHTIEVFERRQAELREEQQTRNREMSHSDIPTSTSLLAIMLCIIVWYILLTYMYGLSVKEMIQIYPSLL